MRRPSWTCERTKIIAPIPEMTFSSSRQLWRCTMHSIAGAATRPRRPTTGRAKNRVLDVAGLGPRAVSRYGAHMRQTAAAGGSLLPSIHQLLDAQRACDRFVLLAGRAVRGEGTLAWKRLPLPYASCWAAAAPMVKREVARYLMVRPVAYEVKACSAGSGSLSWALALED